MKLSQTFAALEDYPFLHLIEAKRRLISEGVEVIDFGVGEPNEITPEFIRQALSDGIEPRSSYPLAPGLSELRRTIAMWISRRFGAALDPDSQIVPTLGTKEAIFHLPQIVGGDTVIVTTPGYPVPRRGALFAGKDVLELPLYSSAGFLPDLDSVANDVWERCAILWLNYPNNPTAATAPLELYEQAASLAREYNFILASDEAYSEVYFGETKPTSALELGDYTNVAVFNTLSKRSSMPGFRAGFVAGDSELIAAMKRYRPNVGVAPQEFVQHAAIAAWSDEEHVADMRELYRAKRDVLVPALAGVGLHHVGGDATFFLWLGSSDGSVREIAQRLLDQGIIVAPGSFFGEAGADYLRLALVPTFTECQRAAEIIRDLR